MRQAPYLISHERFPAETIRKIDVLYYTIREPGVARVIFLNKYIKMYMFFEKLKRNSKNWVIKIQIFWIGYRPSVQRYTDVIT